MFPFGRIPFNFPFLKKDGSISTIGDEINAGGGGGYTLPTASDSTKGGVKIGAGLTMTGEVLSNDNPTPYTLPTAGADTKGGVKVGSGLSIDENGVLSANGGGYTLPTASVSTKGGVKIGNGLEMGTGDNIDKINLAPFLYRKSFPTSSATFVKMIDSIRVWNYDISLAGYTPVIIVEGDGSGGLHRSTSAIQYVENQSNEWIPYAVVFTTDDNMVDCYTPIDVLYVKNEFVTSVPTT